MASIIINTLSDAAFEIIQNGIDYSYNKVCSVRAIGDAITITNKFSAIEIVKNEPYTEFQVDGQTFTNVDDCRTALDKACYSFKSSGGGGTGTETDPLFNTWKNQYFDSNGQLKPEYLPAGVSTPTYLLESEPIEKDANSIYIFPTGGVYQSQFWNGSNWVIIGDFDVSSDLTEYLTQSQIDAIYAKKTDLDGKLSIVSVDGVTITGDGTEGNPLIASVNGTQYPTLVQKLFSGISVIYAWKGNTTSTIIAKSSSAGTVSGSYIDSSDSTMYVFSILPAGISFYLGDDSSENLFYTESVLSIPATMEDLESKQDKLIAGENITIDGNTISASGGGSSSNVTYNRSTGLLTVDGEQVRNLDLGLGGIKADVVTTTGIVEGIGGILAGSFLQNEDGEDYILQKDVEAGYVKKTDLVVDSIPMLNSTNLITSGGVYTPVQQVTTDLSTHKTTDKFRWQDTYDEQLLSIVRDGESQGLKLAGSFGGAEYPLTVTDEYGGIIAMQFINPSVSIFYTVYINGQLKYSSEGLPPNIPITKYMMVKNGDVVTSLNNPNILNYNYFVADTDSPFFKMVQQVTVNQQMIGSLQNDILNVKASIDNKVLDPEPTHVQSILNSTYTVTSSLGGRLNGKGYVLLGLLGVKLVSTGIVDITYTNGKIIREYDNTALVGAGEANPFVIDVDAGTIIVSSGMDSLTFTPYVAK